jgi:hypothetical protein
LVETYSERWSARCMFSEIGYSRAALHVTSMIRDKRSFAQLHGS